MKDGMIRLDSADGKGIGFTSDKFIPHSYLWKNRGTMMISFIGSLQQRIGSFESLCDSIHEKGLRVAVPTPSNMMRRFLTKHKFKQTREFDSNMPDAVEVWIK